MDAISFTFECNDKESETTELKGDKLQDELGSIDFDGIKNEEVESRRDELMDTFRSRQKSLNSSFEVGSMQGGVAAE